MLLNIDGKKIPLEQALGCYKNKRECRKRFNLSNSQYDKLISRMLKAVKKGALMEAAPPQQNSQFPIRSYEGINQKNYASLDSFNNGILPESYSPIHSTREIAQQFSDTETTVRQHQSPNASADWYESQQNQQASSTNIPNQIQSNQSLFDRRFFHGATQLTVPTPMPLRFDDSAPNRQVRQQNRTVQPEIADHILFSRTFDLARQTVPDVTLERQAVGCRRVSTKY